MHKLHTDGLPSEILTKLTSLKDNEYRGELDFVNALISQLDTDELRTHRSLIVKRARKSANPPGESTASKAVSVSSVSENFDDLSRFSEVVETTPVITLSVGDIENLSSELVHYHNIYISLFYRREQHDLSYNYLSGLLLDIPNKSVESIALALKGNDPNMVRAMQNFVSNGGWNDTLILDQHRQEVAKDIGDENGVLIADGSDFPKQGKASVGVKRQMCGELGKRANCQAGVFLGYASQKGSTLLDRRLYLPEEWLSDAFADLRKKCGIPEELKFKTKNQLTLEMIRSAHEAGTLHYRWLTCDEAFGRDTKFLDAVAPIVSYFAEVPCDTHVWLERPRTYFPERKPGRGRTPTREQLCDGEVSSQEVKVIAESLPAEAWSTHTVKEGTKGPIVANFACLRVVNRRDKLPGQDVWLIIRHNINTNEIKYYLSNAPADTTLKTFVWLSGMRWPIETCFEQGKQEIGMGDYQVRSWTGWHHHMTFVILAHFFLVRIKLNLKDKAPQLTLEQAIMLLKTVLPQPDFDAERALEVLSYRQKRNHAAYKSHRKRKIKRLKMAKSKQ